jgi:hypothetical protein
MHLAREYPIYYRTATTLYPAVVVGYLYASLILRVDWGDRCRDVSLCWAPGREEWHRVAPPF